MDAYATFATVLRRTGVDTIFGLLGDANLRYLWAFVDGCDGRLVRSTHEAAAVSMADGYARRSGKLGVASVTHGPGLTNSLTPLVEAVRNGTNLLLVTGSTSATARSSQHVNIAGLVQPTGAGFAAVRSASTLVEDVNTLLCRIVDEGRPFVLDLPADVRGEVAMPASTGSARSLAAVVPAANEVEAAAAAALSARAPLVLAGRGAVLANARDALVRLADLLAAPLATTLLAKDYFRGHPRNLGVCGTISTQAAADIITRSDCVLAFGASMTRHTTSLLRRSRLLRFDGERGDARLAAIAIAESLENAGSVSTPSRAHDVEQRLRAAANERHPDSIHGRLDVWDATRLLDHLLPADRNLVTDAGRFLLAPWRHLHVSDPGRFAHTTNFGSIGLGLPTGIGMAVADPVRPTVVVAGDGGVQLALTEFSTAVRLALPLIVVVLNDGAYGAEVSTLHHLGLDPAFAFHEAPDFAEIARAFGGIGIRAESADDLRAAAPMLQGQRGPVLLDTFVDVPIDMWSNG